jgi:hypothetical protein
MSKGLRIALGIGLIVAGVFTGGAAFVLLGASLAIGAVLEPKLGNLRRLQSQSVMVRSAIQPQEIVYGQTRKSGVVTWFDTSGSNNEYLWFVITICEHEIDSYVSLWIDETEIDIATEIDGSGYVTNASFVDADGNNLVKTGFYLGEATQEADTELVAAFADWDDTHYGNDVAYFWVRLELDKSEGGTDPDNPEANIWSKGWPRDLSVTLKGAKVYDPRLDSTMVIDSTTSPLTYGSGTHDADDSSTWEWSDNSVLCRADYLRSERFGPGYSSSEIDWETVAKQADIADEQVAILPVTSPLTTQARYTLNGVVSVADTPKSIIESMQTADHGTTLFLPDGVKILAGSWDASSHTIDETWLAGQFSATSSTSTDGAYNAVRGQYMSAEENYALIEFQPRTASAYETEDGVGRVWQDIVLPFVSDEYRAQRLAIIELKKSRQQTVVKMQCNFRAELVQLYDIVTLDLPGFRGLDDSPVAPDTFRIVGKASSTDGTTTLEMHEETEDDWTYDVPDLSTAPIIPTIIRGNLGPLPPTNLTAATVANGVQLSWDNASMIGVSHIEVYSSSSNNRAGASLRTKTRSEQYLHLLSEGTTHYYWVIARSENGLVSTWEPLGSTSGVEGIAGAAGTNGDDALRYYIKPTDGTAILNGTGTLTVEAHLSTGGVDAHLSSGNIKLYVGATEVTEANGYGVGSDGYTGIFDSGDINGAAVVELKDVSVSPNVVYDTVTLVDVYDGADGDPGTAGENAVYGYIEPNNPLSWTRDADQSTWTPSGTTVDLDCTFVLAGTAVARKAWRITRNAAGILTGASTTHKDGDLNTGRVTVTELDETSQAMSVKFTYSDSGYVTAVTETVITSMAGADGTDGTDGADGISHYLTNPSPVRACDADGTNYQLPQGSSGVHKIFEGTTDVTTTAAHLITGGAFSTPWYYKTQNGVTLYVNATTGEYYADEVSTNSWTSDEESFTLRAYYKSVYWDLTYTISKVFGGAQGDPGDPGGVVVSMEGGRVSKNTSTPTHASVRWGFSNTASTYYEYKYSGATLTNIATWCLDGTPADYEIRATLISGTDPTSGTMDTWQTCNASTRYWDNLTTTAETLESQLFIQIRLASTGVVVGSCYVTLTANEAP